MCVPVDKFIEGNGNRFFITDLEDDEQGKFFEDEIETTETDED